MKTEAGRPRLPAWAIALLAAILALVCWGYAWMVGEAWDYQWERCDQWQQELREKIEEQGDDWYYVMYGEEEEEER